MNKKAAALILSIVMFASPTVNTVTSMAASSQAAQTLTKAASPTEVKAMKGEDLVKIMQDKNKKDNVLIIDVRSKEEYDAGHLSNAINIPVGEIEKRLSEIADYMDKPVVTYCNSGKKSGDAAKILSEYGFKDINNAQGVKEFTYELFKFRNIRGAELQKYLDEKKDAVILDIRPEKDTKGGVIKGAVLIPLDKLKERMGELPKDKEIVVYCNTGTKSVEAAILLNEAGYNVTNVIEGTKEYPFELVKPE